nr:DUF4411 family protein [Corynebacterium meridianum]
MDTNVIITGSHTYPPDVFPGYWGLLESLQSSGRLLLCQSVFDEIRPAGDLASQWVIDHFPQDDILKITDVTLSGYGSVVEWARAKNNPRYLDEALREFADYSKADAWLVAHAKEHFLTILTNETSSPHKQKRVKIPDAAQSQGINCVSMLELMRRENIRF